MKAAKKQKKLLPEVHILGDVADVQNLIRGLNKKNVIVVFRDEEQSTVHLEIDGKIDQILPDDIAILEKEYKVIYFSYFPSRKRVAVIEVKPEEAIPVKKVKKVKKVQKVKKEKKKKKK